MDSISSDEIEEVSLTDNEAEVREVDKNEDSDQQALSLSGPESDVQIETKENSETVTPITIEGNSDQVDQSLPKKRPHPCDVFAEKTQQRTKYLFGDEMKFMNDFDPSSRVDKKRSKRYTDSGVIEDRCDCLILACPGCHFPCPECGSRLCADVCRKGRTWNYEEIEIQGRGIIRRCAGYEKY